MLDKIIKKILDLKVSELTERNLYLILGAVCICIRRPRGYDFEEGCEYSYRECERGFKVNEYYFPNSAFEHYFKVVS